MNNTGDKIMIAVCLIMAVVSFIGGFWNPWHFGTCGMCLMLAKVLKSNIGK